MVVAGLDELEAMGPAWGTGAEGFTAIEDTTEAETRSNGDIGPSGLESVPIEGASELSELEARDRSGLRKLYDALDTLGSQAWMVNKRIFDVRLQSPDVSQRGTSHDEP